MRLPLRKRLNPRISPPVGYRDWMSVATFEKTIMQIERTMARRRRKILGFSHSNIFGNTVFREVLSPKYLKNFACGAQYLFWTYWWTYIKNGNLMSQIMDPPRGGGGSRPAVCAQTPFIAAFTAQHPYGWACKRQVLLALFQKLYFSKLWMFTFN